MRVVCIDDEKIMLRGITNICKEIDAIDEVKSFTDAEEALDYILDNDVDVVFSDINMPSLDGMKLGKVIKEDKPNTKLVFTTGYDEYALDAFKIHASGYLMKPVKKEDVIKELQNIQAISGDIKKLEVKTFGNFEVFINGLPVEFSRRKTKELLAYLVDRSGAICTNNEIIAVLWDDDEDHLSYLKKLRRDLMETLEAHNYENVIVSRWGGLGVYKDAIKCDLYDYHNGIESAREAYNGEYMLQYSWAEESASKPKEYF